VKRRLRQRVRKRKRKGLLCLVEDKLSALFRVIPVPRFVKTKKDLYVFGDFFFRLKKARR
jgi:hypothetical protein